MLLSLKIFTAPVLLIFNCSRSNSLIFWFMLLRNTRLVGLFLSWMILPSVLLNKLLNEWKCSMDQNYSAGCRWTILTIHNFLIYSMKLVRQISSVKICLSNWAVFIGALFTVSLTILNLQLKFQIFANLRLLSW